jgi:hypothetical protein
MSAAEIARAVAQARAERSRTAAPPIAQNHHCTVGCVTVGCRKVRVCVASLKIHVCPGPSCEHARASSEGVVCGLSGFEIAPPSDNVVSAFQRENGVVATTTRHWGHAERSSRASGGRAAPRETDRQTRLAIESHVTLFMASRPRHDIYTAELDKVKSVAVKLAKTTRGPTSFSAAITAAMSVYTERASLCRPPAPSEAPWLKTLAKAIFDFWKGLREWMPMRRKNAAAFVATVLSMMAEDGLKIGGVRFIHSCPIVRRHCPRPRQMGLFTGRMTCRRVTQQTRALKAALTLDSGRPRIVPALDFA